MLQFSNIRFSYVFYNWQFFSARVGACGTLKALQNGMHAFQLIEMSISDRLVKLHTILILPV